MVEGIAGMNILGYEYKMKSKKMKNALGKFRFSKLEIVIHSEQDAQQRESTVLHEMIHAISAHLKLDLSEEVTARLETGLYQSLTNSGVDLSPLTKELEQ